jgi:hypothetical protein
LKAIQKVEKRSLGRIASELLADALGARRRSRKPAPVEFAWHQASMRARVDLVDKEAVYAILDENSK